MKIKIIAVMVSIVVIIVACAKDKFQTRPQIKVKSVSSNVISPGETLSITLEYTDKEGDLSQDTLLSIRNRLNRRKLPVGSTNVDTLHNIIPKFPEKNTGEFDVSFQWATYLHQSDIENDTIMFKFVVKDRAGNISDTVSSEKIVILRQ